MDRFASQTRRLMLGCTLHASSALPVGRWLSTAYRSPFGPVTLSIAVGTARLAGSRLSTLGSNHRRPDQLASREAALTCPGPCERRRATATRPWAEARRAVTRDTEGKRE